MQLYKLPSAFPFFPSDTIQISSDDSLIWTERFQTNGEFTLEKTNDLSVLSALPIGTLVSHTDTHQVMIVEDHQVERDKEKQLKVKVTGRTFETFLENRLSPASFSPLYDGSGNQIVFTSTDTGANLALYLINRTIVYPVTLIEADGVPGISAQVIARVSGIPMTHAWKRGEVYSQMMDLLALDGYGIKTYLNTLTGTIWFYLHDGIDRTASVTFYSQYEDLEDSSYLMSSKGLKTNAQVATHTSGRVYLSKDYASDPTGLDRRYTYLEEDDLIGVYNVPSTSDALATRAQAELNYCRKKSIMDAKVSLSAKPKFKLNYDIGDLVTLVGEFNAVQTMRVTEHILTVDANGQQGYPALSLP